MSTQLSDIITQYFAASNNQDSQAVLSLFDRTATVVDKGEGQTLNGHDEIKDWLDGTIASYKLTAEVLNWSDSEAGQSVEVSVSGDFPGSPLQFTYLFQVVDKKISRLEIS